jgi:hypothetical protein
MSRSFLFALSFYLFLLMNIFVFVNKLDCSSGRGNDGCSPLIQRGMKYLHCRSFRDCKFPYWVYLLNKIQQIIYWRIWRSPMHFRWCNWWIIDGKLRGRRRAFYFIFPSLFALFRGTSGYLKFKNPIRIYIKKFVGQSKKNI